MQKNGVLGYIVKGLLKNMKGENCVKKINLRDFALHFCFSGNATEAAVAAGVTPLRAKIEGLKLLARKPVRNHVKRISDNKSYTQNEVLSGLERLAFGRINDAAELAFSEDITKEKIARADLFNVSEIRRIKGGGVEIKFFDRQKAIEKLAECIEKLDSEENAKSLVESIYGKAEEADISSDTPLEEDDE